MHVHKSVLGLIAGALAVLLVGVVVSIAASRQPESTYPPGSPEATIAEFVRLIEDGQLEEAYELTSIPGLTQEEFVERFSYQGDASSRVTLVRSDVDGDTATVVVDVSTFSPDGPLDSSDYTYRETYQLRREAGRWVITGPEYFRF